MWVSLSIWGHKAVLRLTAMDQTIWEQLQIEVVTDSAQKLHVNAPYAAWKFAWRKLYDTNFGPRHGKRPFGEMSCRKAMQAITREINYVDSHPALQGLGMFDIHSDVFHVWEIEPTEQNPRKYSPYPMPGHRFVILTPVSRTIRQQPELTWWVPHESGVGRLAIEAVHLSCWRHPVV